MSHVTRRKTIPGQPHIIDLFAAQMAVEQGLGMQFRLPEGCHIEYRDLPNGERTTVIVDANSNLAQANMHYRTYNSDHGGRGFGDWRQRSNGHDAIAVITMSPEQIAARSGEYAGVQPYEVGVIADPNNPGKYTLSYDPFMEGYGITPLIGQPIYDKSSSRTGECEVLCPTIDMHYRMACDVLAARELGDTLTFEQQQDGSYVGYVATQERLGV